MTEQTVENLTKTPSLRHHLREHWLAAFLVGVLLITMASFWQYHRFVPTFNQQMHTVMSVAAPLIEQAMQYGATDQVSAALIGLTNHPNIIYGVVVDAQGQRIAKINRQPQQRSTRWLTETLFGVNYPIRYAFSAENSATASPPSVSPPLNRAPGARPEAFGIPNTPPSSRFAGYVQIEIDTNALAHAFLNQIATIIFCVLAASIILATLISWLTHFQTTRPLDNIIKTLAQTDIHNPSDKRITHDEMVLTPSLGLLTNQINRLLEQVNTNVMRRERAEDDLRKNLASLDYIVAERTEALRDSNKRLQTLVTTMESRIEQTETVAQLRLDFLTIMGHEIKTNLTGLSTLLASEIDNLQNNHHTQNLQVVHNSEHFLLQMIDDILDLSRLDASKLKLKHRQFDLGELIEQVTSLHHAEARLKGVELYSAIPANFPCVFIGDDARIRQILNTLTLNILTFSDHGELCLSVEQRDEQTVVIRIQDSGISIAADAFNAIFKPISSDLDLGTGVTLNDWGLTLVNRLLSLMNATAELKHDTSCYELAITIPLREFRHEFDDELSLDKLNDLHITVISTAPSSGTRILLRYLNGWSTHVHHIQKVPVSDYSPEEINRIINSDFCIVDQLNSITALNDQLHALSITQRTRYLLLAEAQHFPSTDTIQALNITSVLPLPLHRRPLLTTLLLHTHASPATPEQSTAQTSTAQAAVSQSVTQVVTQADTMENPLAWIHQEKELHVLLVEDNPISAMLYNTLLRNMHCRILNAQNGMEALELIPSGPFDIIFMDCHMPEMDGYEATALIRESLSEEKLPIIALTADTSHQNRNHCRQAGMNDLLQKPSSQAELASMLDTWIWHRHDKIQHGYPVTDRHPT